MKIETDHREIISLGDFELGWRWEKTHNSSISEFEIQQIRPFSKSESKRLNKTIAYFELEQNLIEKYFQTDWINANAENDEKVQRFRNQLEIILKSWDEDVIISWERNVALKTTKAIFIKYWTDFLYPGSDDVTVISEETNWILFYKHFEVAKMWTKV
ncbi:hypothetical protein [Flavobacterium sp.]|uniref:hypothetical protein n=1 Tax=Flavobacterium sp. TaxID=239 RepID=UPI0026321A62|nr:hypothetical protein [Flavobacterium sp.]